MYKSTFLERYSDKWNVIINVCVNVIYIVVNIYQI